MEDRKTENDNEQEMLRGIQRGDAAAAQALYRSHVRYLSAIASRYIACEEDLRDVLQDCFLKIFSSIASFTYQGPGSLKGWMAKITLNETLKFIRKSGRLEFTELNRHDAEPTDEDPDTEADYYIVHFALACEPLLDGSVYLHSDLFNNVLDERSKMGYNFDTGQYEKAVLMKQGSYNYQYLFVPNGSTTGQTAPLEGDFYQTQNEYSIYVYYRSMGTRYDRLIGVTTVRNDMEVF